MSSSKVYMLIMLKKLMNEVECRPELIHFLRHRVDGDDRVILMLPCGLTTEGNPSTGWAIPYMVHLEIADEERPRVNQEVSHLIVDGELGERRVIFGVFWGGRGRLWRRMRMRAINRLFLLPVNGS